MLELLKKNKDVLWEEQCEKGFIYTMEILEKPTILARHRFDQPLNIQCDASGSAIGFMLSQDLDDQLKTILFEGGVLSETGNAVYSHR